jgi:hypothetical protein
VGPRMVWGVMVEVAAARQDARARNRWEARPWDRFKERKALKCPLLGRGGVVGLTEPGRVVGAELRPFVIGLGEDARGGFEEGGVGTEGVWVGEVGSEEIRGWRGWKRGVLFVEKQSVGEVAEAS